MKSSVMGHVVHQLYEYRKGVRQLFMMTMTTQEAAVVVRRLQAEAIEHYAHRVSAAKANVFFGRAPCVELVRRMVTKPLCHLTPEEDFILGTLLGYDREQQCLRFLAMTGGPRQASA
ncbi:hypothetical protein A6A04_15585 [Paramagnetospirillum marisnigri]|uniref:DUF2023 domain-containing protein n=1 Tax=Paramagnetospirillum marisnigri TaxID=1285242 RepID=A0A178MSJ9_9PROT|nr:DUF2023 family protein [Paramagnetospirillum marisnigri]OAN52721.1 hypothetical protein A6A04_15585 [Paramagnetospirillum marisnigri]